MIPSSTSSNKDEITKQFTSEIADLVDGVTKLTNMQLTSTETKEAENVRKLLMAIHRMSGNFS